MPLDERWLWVIRRFSGGVAVAQAQGAQKGTRGRACRWHHRRMDHRRCADRSALGRVLAFLPGYRRAQMGPPLPDPPVLLDAWRDYGRQGAADAGAAGWAADCGRAQPDRRGYALRPLLGLFGGCALPPFRTLLL